MSLAAVGLIAVAVKFAGMDSQASGAAVVGLAIIAGDTQTVAHGIHAAVDARLHGVDATERGPFGSGVWRQCTLSITTSIAWEPLQKGCNYGWLRHAHDSMIAVARGSTLVLR